MKGVFCLGCSYTWGEGLYFYSGLDDIPFNEYHNFDMNDMRAPFHAYRKKYRWPRLISDKLDTWEYTSEIGNGGANIQHYNFCVHQNMAKGNIKYSDFSLFIWQITDPIRDMSGGYDLMNSGLLSNEEVMTIVNDEVERQICFMDRMSKEWEARGVKVITFSWFDDIVNNLKYKELFKDRHMDIEYNGIVYDHFSPLINTHELNDPPITVRDDFYEKGYQKNDLHFNKLGHQIISDNIYRKLKQDNFI